MPRAGHFGAGVIGVERAAAEKSIVDERRNVFGPGVLGTPAVAVTTAPKPEPTSVIKAPSMSLVDLEVALAENPLLVDELFAAEVARSSGPRKGALGLLQEAEARRPGGPRLEVVAAVSEASAAKE